MALVHWQSHPVFPAYLQFIHRNKLGCECTILVSGLSLFPSTERPVTKCGHIDRTAHRFFPYLAMADAGKLATALGGGTG
jgi:hypothetical protein